MKNLLFHMDVDTALEFFARVKSIEENSDIKLSENERIQILIQMAEEGLIKAVMGTDRSREEIIRDAARHGKVLHIKTDGTQEEIK